MSAKKKYLIELQSICTETVIFEAHTEQQARELVTDGDYDVVATDYKNEEVISIEEADDDE